MIRKCAAHADATLALSDTCRLQDDTTASKELLERLLLVLEKNFHPRCSIGSGKNRFDYNRPENRPLFGGLFRFAPFLRNQGRELTVIQVLPIIRETCLLANSAGAGEAFTFTGSDSRSPGISPAYSTLCCPMWRV